MQTTLPVSEALMFAIAGAINQCLTNSAQVGDLIWSDLAEAAFQDQRDDTWVLCDGRSVIGSQYQALTGLANVPDRRGRFLRMKDNGAGVDTNGDLAIGTLVADQVGTHAHTFALTQRPANNGPNPPALGTDVPGGASNNESTSSFGGAETQPRYSVSNCFVKIDP